MKRDYRRAGLEPREQALLDYAAKLTVRPWAMAEADVEALRGQGWTDTDVLDLNQIVSYFNLLTRTAEGLGVELEPELGPPERGYLEDASRLRAEILGGTAP